MSSVAKVVYWPGRGRAEPLRCILAASGVEWENNMIHNKQDYENLLKVGKLEYGQVPLVEVDGLNLVQGYPTACYLAKVNGLYPCSTPQEEYFVGQVFAASQDARLCFLPFPFHGSVEKVLEELKKPKGLFSRYAPKWEETLTKTQEKGPFFLGDKPSIADVGVFEVMDFFRDVTNEKQMQEEFSTFPRLIALHDAVLGLGRLKEWIDVGRKEDFIDWSKYAEEVKVTLGW